MSSVTYTEITDQLFNDSEHVRREGINAIHEACACTCIEVTNVLLPICIDDVTKRMRCRTAVRDDRRDFGTEAALGYPDAEGWGSLETSLTAIRTMLSWLPSISAEHSLQLMDLIGQLHSHTNRFVRELTQDCLCELIHLMGSEFPKTHLIFPYVSWIQAGLTDNWSRVRYSAINTFRAVVHVELCTEGPSMIDPLIPDILLNRHFVAEGVRRLAQEAWRVLVGPKGGKRLILNHLSPLLKSMHNSCSSGNHSVREAAVACTVEIFTRILKQTVERVAPDDRKLILSICIASVEDSTWSVREIGVPLFSVLLTSHEFWDDSLVRFFHPQIHRIVPILLRDCMSHVTPLRESACGSLPLLLAVTDKFGLDVNDRISGAIVQFFETQFALDVGVLAKSHNNVRRVTGDAICFENQTMYSCGSLLSNVQLRQPHTHSQSDDCCSGGTVPDMASPRDRIEGAMRLLLALRGEDGRFDSSRDLLLVRLEENKEFRGIMAELFLNVQVDENIRELFSHSN
jgi:hypothetical protein